MFDFEQKDQVTLMSLDWDRIRYFIAVADHGSVSRAAQALEVSHATILRATERLEADLQIRLFDRARSGYRLTEDGIAILPYARGMATEAAKLQLQARARDSLPSGELNLALPDQTLFNAMTLLRDFSREHPNIALNIKRAEVRRTDDFLTQGVDLLLMVTDDAPDDFVGRRLCHIDFGVYSAPADATTEHDRGWVRWSSSGGFGAGAMDDMQLQMQRLAGFATHKVLDAGSHDNAVAAIRAGLGSGLVARQAASELTPIKVSGRMPAIGLWCLTHPDFRATARVSALMRFMADALA